MKSHKDLKVWKDGIQLVKAVYLTTSGYPKEEMYGLTAQMRRAAVSVVSNIAEGAARQGNKEFIQFLYIALGSASELDTQIEVSGEIGFGDGQELHELQKNLETISKMIQGLIRSVKQSAHH
jgi:four helix bundle protein